MPTSPSALVFALSLKFDSSAVRDRCFRFAALLLLAGVVQLALFHCVSLAQQGVSRPHTFNGRFDANQRLEGTYTTAPVATASRRDVLFRELQENATFLERQYRQIKRIVQFVRPSIVHIDAKKRQRSAVGRNGSAKASDLRPVIVEEAGSGVIIEHRNRTFVLTNFHVVENSRKTDIRIEADGKVFYPINLMHDRSTDISVLEVNEPNLIPAKIGDSSQMDVGDFVVAVGSPFGLSNSVSYGIVSALGRHDLELGPQGVRYQNFMQTDAAINPGNSGGPLINLRGEVIGLNTAIASNSGGSDGIGFSIPMNMALRIARDLMDNGAVRRGFLGVSLDARFGPATARSLGMRRTQGARVSEITPNSPASRSELQIGDVILEFNHQTVLDDSHLITTVSVSEINASVPIKVFRRGQLKTVYVTVGVKQPAISQRSPVVSGYSSQQR